MPVNAPVQILYNGKINTCNPVTPLVSAIAVQNGRILAVGSNEDLLGGSGDRGQNFDLHGQTVIPGLIDAHIHIELYAFSLNKVNCETGTRAECLQSVAERARMTPAGEWILGHGWNQNDWPEGFGSTADLDAVAPDHPVYLTAKSLHAGWANSAALNLSGITDTTLDPAGGKLGRDLHGKPDGILFESAMELMRKAIPAPDAATSANLIGAALPGLWQVGITGIHDFDQSRCFSALQILNQRGDLKLRVVKSVPIEDLPHAVALGLRSGFGDEFLRIGSLKAFADGALGPQTAAMLQPYEGNPDNRGLLLLDAEEFVEVGKIAVENGLSLAVHAIGDRANHEMLDAFRDLQGFERSLRSDRAGMLRHRIEHVQLLHPDDAHRLGSLGIIASMQPIHATSDMLMADRHWGSRAALAYAWRTQLNNHAVLAFGSDAPVESPNPFWGIFAAVTRRRQDGTPGLQGWYPEQRLTVSEALRGYTLGPAYAAGMEAYQGQLSPGFFADLVVLDTDPFFCDPEQLPFIHSVRTMIAGEWVWNQ